MPDCAPSPLWSRPLDDVVCPPYDVITEEQRQELLGRSPHNIVRVELPNGDYAGAAELLGQWQATGALAAESAPALYGYRMTYRSPDGQTRHTLGVMGALVLEPPGQGILPHEHTTPKAKSDRLQLLRATRYNTSPIWCLCSEPGLAQALGAVPGGGDVVTARATDDDGNLHELWPIFSPEVHRAVAGVIAARPLLVADGHHRYETALTYQAEQRQQALVPTSGADGLRRRAVLRRRTGRGAPPGPGHPPGRLRAAGGDRRGRRPGLRLRTGPTAAHGADLLARMAATGSLAVVTRDGSYLASPRAGAPGAGPDLDSRRADAAVADLPPTTDL